MGAEVALNPYPVYTESIDLSENLKRLRNMRESISKKHTPAMAGLIFCLFCLLVLPGCGSDKPEEQIKKLVDQAEAAAEEKSAGEFRSIISENYHDEAGRNRKEVIGLIRYYFIRNKQIYVLSRIKSIEFPEPGQAQVVVLAAVAGKPIDRPDELKNIQGDLHRIEFTAKKSGDEWKVTRASWSRALIEDFSFI